MSREATLSGKRTYRERSGRYGEDFRVGDVREPRPDLEARANYGFGDRNERFHR